ncbi:MAG: cytochrome P450 [Actinomycetota bacterium]
MAVDLVQSVGTGAVPAGPRGAPVVGSLLDLRKDPLRTLYDAMLRYGDVVRFAGGAGAMRVEAFGLFSPEGAHHVLAAASDAYGKLGPTFQAVRDLLGNGLLTSEGEEWRRQKRMVQPLFTHRRVAGYVPMMVEEADILIRSWADAAGSRTVDLHRDMTTATLRVVGRVLFGADVDHAVEVLHDPVPYLSQRAVRRALSPVKVPASWPTPANRKAARYHEAMHGVVDDMIASRRGSQAGGDDLLSLLLGAQDPENGQGLTDAEVHDQALIFLLAGHETTATSLTFTLHLLGHHPEAERRVHEEVRDVLGGGDPTLEGTMALQYTTMVVKEAMRLYPAAYRIPRVPAGDEVFEGYRIPAGAPVMTSPWVTQRHPRHWDAPARFDPGRFTPDREKARHRYAYFPFGGGPRACIGQYFSMLEAVLIVARLVQAFEVTTTERAVPLATGITLRPAAAMPASVTLR